MNRHYPGYRLGELFVYAAASRLIDEAPRFEILPQFFRVHRKGSRLDIHKVWLRAALGNRLRGGDEGIGDGQNDFAQLDTSGHERETKRIGAAVNSDATVRSTKLGELSFKITDFWSTDKRGYS